MNNQIEKIFKSRRVFIVSFIAIMAIGIFLRTFHFHDYLHFGKDQARDAAITQSVARGESAWPLLGAAMGNTPFKIGPIYYYFQIISAKIFGQSPEVLAFPDLLFSILSIPLLYLLLKIYFSRNLSLILAGLYSVSYFSIIYSRFAWNPNPIPFFAILFIMSLYEFLIAAEKTNWKWIVAAGIAIGTGVQLHAILMILFPLMSFLVLLFIFVKNRNTWKKIAVIFLIAVALNPPQIVSEFKSNFKNTKIFISSLNDKSSPDKGEFKKNVELNIACHAQANMHIISSLGDKYDCNFLFVLSEWENNAYYNLYLLLIISSFLFSLFGYVALVYKTKNSDDIHRKYFLGLIILYCLLYFPLLMPAIDGASHRYFIGLIFVPYIFLGFLLEHLIKNKSKIFQVMAIVIILFLIGTNLFSVQAEAKQLQNKTRGDSGYAVLGEIEVMKDYMISKSERGKTIYLFGGSNYLPFYAVPMQYIFSKENVEIIRGRNEADVSPNSPVFYIWKNSDGNPPAELDGRKVEDYKDFGQIGIYHLQN